MSDIPERILEEAYRLAKESIFHGGVDWAAGDIAKALAAAEQRGREMERERASKLLISVADILKRHMLDKLPAELLESLAEAIEAANDEIEAIRSRSEGKGE